MSQTNEKKFYEAVEKGDDTIFFGVALDEFDRDEIDKGVWAKAISKAGGDEFKAKSIYLKMRAKNLFKYYDEKNHNRVFEINKKRREDEKPIIAKESQKEVSTAALLIAERNKIISKICGILTFLVFVFSYILVWSNGSLDEMSFIIILVGILLMSFSVFLFMNSNKIIKNLNDIDYIKTKLFSSFYISIPVTITIIIVGFLAPLLALLGIIILFSLLINLFKFIYHLNRYKKNSQ